MFRLRDDGGFDKVPCKASLPPYTSDTALLELYVRPGDVAENNNEGDRGKCSKTLLEN